MQREEIAVAILFVSTSRLGRERCEIVVAMWSKEQIAAAGSGKSLWLFVLPSKSPARWETKIVVSEHELRQPIITKTTVIRKN